MSPGHCRLVAVVIVPPCSQHEPGMSQRGEQGLVEAFVAQVTIGPKVGEANLSRKLFCIGLPYRDAVPLDPPLL